MCGGRNDGLNSSLRITHHASPLQMTRGRIQVAAITIADGRTIHYDEAGSGPALLFIAGLGSPRGGWTDAMEGLSHDFRCLAIDNRDAGENDPESTPYSIADMA